MNTGPAIIKIGGIPARDGETLRLLATEVASLSAARGVGGGESIQFAIVHGGGTDVSALSQRLGIKPRFSDGIRMTTDDEMDLVDMVLCGLVNKRLVRLFSSCGIAVLGISGADGSLLTGTPVSDAQGNASRTAHVSDVSPEVLRKLWASGFVPIIASPGSDGSGGAVNINADEAALALGGAVRAKAIVFLSDVPGVKGSDGEVIGSLSIREAEALIQRGIVTNGMVAKLRSAAGAIVAGVHHIVIGGYEESGDLERLLSGHVGTTIYGD